jgi:serine/threonine-protein kinase
MNTPNFSAPANVPGSAPVGAVETTSFPYRIQGKVGEGAMGVVFRATESALGRPVAIKFLKLEPGPVNQPTPATREMHLRFLQEARSAAAIQHPGAVTIYRVGQERNVPFIAMEWLDGETLAARLARVGRLGVEEACDFAIQALDALQAAHDAGVVHRDIKPANLMILRDGRVKVLDFGIARFRRANLLETESGVMLGTPAYAAPEQLRSEEVDARSDLYSLGMVLYEALAGRLPHSADSLLELATKVLRETPTPIEVIRPELPPALVQGLSRALAKDRAARWPSAREMARALRAAAPPRPSPADAAAVASPAWERASTIALPHPESGGLVYRGVPAQLPLAVAHLVSSWPAQAAPAQSVERLLARLLDKPPHAPAFSGGVAVGSRLLLLHDGQVLAAIERRNGRHGAEVSEDLGDNVPAQLHPVPDALPRPTVQVLAGLLGTATLVQGGLDSSIVHLPGLAAKLASEQFDGVVRVHREGGEGRIVLVAGEPVLAFFSGNWEDVDLEQAWTAWVGQFPLGIEIERMAPSPLDLTWSLRLRDLELICELSSAPRTSRGSGSLTSRRMPLLTRRLSAPATTLDLSPVSEVEPGAEGWRESPAVRLLGWLLTEGASHFADAKVVTRWKYLAEWLPLVRRAKLYTELRKEGRSRVGRFDLATLDRDGKVLHLAKRFARIDAAAFRRALALAIEEKESRIAGGDIGGVIFAAPEFPPEVIALYVEAIESHASGFRRLQENLTGYAGFVRIGSRRGFHLLLVEERAGGFSPLDV